MYFVFICFITALTLALPVIVPRLSHRFNIPVQAAPAWLPILAAVLYFSAGFIPDIHISRETNSFQEHFVGGGLYTTVLFIYFTRLAGWRRSWLVTFPLLYAWTSALGVANELLEFALVKLNITWIDITDTSWDLVANTAGMVAAFVAWYCVVRLRRPPKNRP